MGKLKEFEQGNLDSCIRQGDINTTVVIHKRTKAATTPAIPFTNWFLIARNSGRVLYIFAADIPKYILGTTKAKEDTYERTVMSQESPTPSSISNQLAEFAIKVLRPGGVSIGGTYGLWSLFVEQDVAKAIASALIGFCFSYAIKLLEPIHISNQRRLQGAGQAIDQSIDNGIEQLLAKTNKAEDAYLLCQALACRDYKSEGIGARNRIFMPVLDEVFVTLELDDHYVSPCIQSEERSQLKEQRTFHFQDRQQIWNFLVDSERVPAYRQLAILAWGGYGKTTLLKYLTYIYGTKEHRRFKVPFRVPILLPLRNCYQSITQKNQPSLPQLIETYHLNELAKIDSRVKKLPVNWAQDLLIKGKALVLIDGFDEVPQPQRIATYQWIMVQLQRFDRSIFILTSRPKAYQDNFIEPFRTQLWVRPLSPEQQADFVHKWYFAQEKLARGGRSSPEVQKEASYNAENLIQQIRDPNRPELGDLAKIPLLLNLLATYHRSELGVQLPSQRVELYQDICTLQLRKRPEVRGIKLLLSYSDRQKVLQTVALRLMQRSQKLIAEAELVQLIAESLESKKLKVDPQEFLNQIIDVSELIVRQGLEGCEFTHLSFQEFLAAVEIKAQNQEILLYPHLQDANRVSKDISWWRSTILMYAAQTDPTSLIQEALSQGAHDLAYACWQTTQHTLDVQIVENLKKLKPILQASRYTRLEELLQAKQWREADDETYQVMIQTVEKEGGQLFDSSDLLQFPSEDLRIIDNLWRRYSQDHYGFSIQKKIYMECGGRLDGEYPSNEVWDVFAAKVGWLVRGEWIEKYDSKFWSDDTIQLHGHLPCVVFLGGYARRLRWGLIPLMSHKDL